MFFFFFFNDTATTEIYTLSLHDALPIFDGMNIISNDGSNKLNRSRKECRSEERFSRNAETDLVCRLLLEKKKKNETNSAKVKKLKNSNTDITSHITLLENIAMTLH